MSFAKDTKPDSPTQVAMLRVVGRGKDGPERVLRLGLGTGKPLTEAALKERGLTRREGKEGLWYHIGGMPLTFELTVPVEVVQPRERKPRLKTQIQRVERATGRPAAGVTFAPDGSRTIAVDVAKGEQPNNPAGINPWDEVPNYGENC